MVLGLGDAVFAHQHGMVEVRRIEGRIAAGEAHEMTNAVAPGQIHAIDHLALNAPEQHLDGVPHVAGEQCLLVREVLVQRAD